MINYNTSPNLPKGNELVTSARKNSSYQVLRVVLRWFLWTLWGGIIIIGLSALSLGDKFFDVVSIAGAFTSSNTTYSKREIGPSLETEISILELSATFSSSELRSSFNTRRTEKNNKKEIYMRTADNARAERDQTQLRAAVGLVNALNVEIADLTNAKNKLEARINEIDEQRKTSLGEIQARVQAGYIFMVILIVIILALLVYALYQAAIVVIDIADCQVEIFARSKEGAGKLA